MAYALAFDHITLETLDPFLIAFQDLIVNGDVVTCFEFRELFLSCQLLVYKCCGRVHGVKF